ncbi:MAG: fibronectin type III domain-containing protein [Nitrospirae bacterium]|nr:fibronectin type III domain-containing protein [Nitrospirota bacterium]
MFHIVIVFLLSVFGCGVQSRESANEETKTDTGSVTLSWKAPVSDARGSNLHDLAGYKIYYGMSSMNYIRSIDVGHFTEAAISNLSSGTWCFSVTAYDASGNESKFSNEMCKTI